MPDHEVRLALVMNGGVSLAVWIAGVTHEIDLIRRASTEGTPRPRAHDEKIGALWRELLRPHGGSQRRLVIDVVAGTSAGGLNSAMLATAIAHNGTLDPEPDPDEPNPVVPRGTDGPWLREVWCTLGGLRQGNLLPRPHQNTGSILDGEFFLTSAEKIMETLSRTGSEADPRAEHRPAVTLFTTASGLGKQQYAATDAADQTFDVADHRFLYRLTTDKPLAYDPATLSFTEATGHPTGFDDPKVLAFAARASASFPVAFQPVRELEALNKVPPRRRPQAVSATSSWLMDGGVLDNAPFAPVIDTIAKGPVVGDISRFIVYVVPSAGVGTHTTKVDDHVEGPPGWRTTLLSAVQYPREVDFRSDVEELEQLRVEAETAWSDTQHLYEAAVRSDEERRRVLEAAKHLYPTYTRGRAAGAVWEAITVGEAGRVTLLDKDAAEPMKAADRILAMGLGCTPPINFDIVTLVSSGGTGGPRWPWGLGPAERVVRTVLRSTRSKLTDTLKDQADALEGAAAEDARAAEKVTDLEHQLQALSTARRSIFSLRAAVGSAIEDGYAALAQPLEGERTRKRPSVDEVAALVRQIFADLRVPEALGQEIAALERELPDGPNLLQVALAVEVVSRCTASRMPDQRSVPFSFVRLGTDVDLPVAGREGQEIAKTLGNRILYGTQVGHFGAFGADEWRRWDWLMGRLHAASHIGMLLHDTSTPEKRRSATDWIRNAQAEILKAEGSSPSELLEGLKTLQADYQDTDPGYGLARMLDAMNAADHGRPSNERSTQQLGDRMVAVAPALGTAGTWVEALTSRGEAPGSSRWQQRARWFVAPLRAALWEKLTAHPMQPEDATSNTPYLLRRTPWATALLAAILALVLGVYVTYEGPKAGGLALVALGVGGALVGGAGLWLVRRLTQLRNNVTVGFDAKLQQWLPPRR